MSDRENLSRRSNDEGGGKSGSRFLVLLLALFLLLMAVPFIGALKQKFFTGLIAEATFAFVLVSAALAVASSVGETRASVSMAAVCALLSWVAYQTGSRSVSLTKDALSIIFLIYVIVLIVRFLFRQRTVTHDTVAASLCGYILIGVCWAMIYSLIGKLQPDSFNTSMGQGDVRFGGRGTVTSLYFSLVTLTTLGFGDITPASNIARMLTVVQALVGQIYLVVLIARLVGLQNLPDGKNARN